MRELLWSNCSPVCGLSARWLSGEAHMLCLLGLLQPEPLFPWQATVDPCHCKRHSNTQRQIWLSLLWVPWVLVHTRFCWNPLSISGGLSFDSKHDFTPPTILLWLLLCPWIWCIFFLLGFSILLSTVFRWLVAIFESSQEKMSACPSTLPSYIMSIHLLKRYHSYFCKCSCN